MGKIIVQKYGGSSLATLRAIRKVADKVLASRQEGFDVVVVASAMGHTTDHLVRRACKISSDPDRRELDALLATGEQATTALLALAIREAGHDAISLTGGQCGIRTNTIHGNARILEVRPARLLEELARGRIVVVAGFQGLSDGEEDVTTLGRGGSDTTAVVLAAALGAEYCDIFTDVDGVYSADPRVVAGARHLETLEHREMEAMGWHGARVLKAEAVEFARDNGVRVRVLSTSGSERVTRVESSPGPESVARWRPRRSAVAGVSGRSDLISMTIYTNDTALHKALFATIEGYDLIFGSLNPSSTRSELYLSTEEMPDIGAFRAEITRSFGDAIGISPRLGAVSLIGFGIGSRPAALFEALKVVRQKDIDVIETFTEREALTFVVPVKRVTDGVRVLHAAFIENEVDSSECDRGNEIAPPGNRTSRDSYHEDLRTSRV